jgi:Mn2+/Fe2+ NRAMP family transporter
MRFTRWGRCWGAGAAVVFAVALLCSGLSSSTVGVMAGQVIIEGFLDIKFPIFLRRFITVVPALIVIGIGFDPLKILNDSQVLLSFTLPAALIPLLLLTNREGDGQVLAARRGPASRDGRWRTIIVALNAVLAGAVRTVFMSGLRCSMGRWRWSRTRRWSRRRPRSRYRRRARSWFGSLYSLRPRSGFRAGSRLRTRAGFRT